MCEHILVPDNLDVARDTAIRLGWYFCIKCGKKFPSEKVRYKKLERKYSKVETVKSKPKRIYRRRKKTSITSVFELELKDEPWIDDNGQVWVISPDGSAVKPKSW